MQDIYDFIQKIACAPSNHEELLSLLQVMCAAMSSPAITIEAAPLVSASIVILISYLTLEVTEAMAQYLQILQYLVKGGYAMHHSINFDHFNLSPVSNTFYLIVSNEKQHSILAMIHGLIKVSPKWLLTVSSDDSNFSTLLSIYSIIESYCQETNFSLCYQSFVVLDLWCKTLKNRVCSQNFIEADIFEILSICSLNPKNPGKLLKFLSMHWETSVKGIQIFQMIKSNIFITF